MEVVAATPNGGGVPPFHDHDVREWSRIDSITGALERARLETDRWSANTINSSHKYGKVVDSRARTDADGALQQQARRQLEVYQSQIPGGHLQVIKTHTVSSSRWTNKSPTIGFGSKDFENLQLSLNPLDLSSQKSKASVGRSASRRPPSRQRPREASSAADDAANPLRSAHATAATNLHRVSRLCHQIHETAVRQAFGKRSPRPSIGDRQSGDGSVEIYEIESVSPSETRHTNLTRTKSSSSDDIHVLPEKDSSNKSVEDLEDLEQLQNWRRTSKIRRSLQFPRSNKTSTSKPLDLPENSVSVRKIREDLEKGRRLNTALRNNSVDLEALDQILQSISSSSSTHSDKNSEIFDDIEGERCTSRKQKRNSFVTVESIQEVKGRLRRTSSPTNDIYKINGKEEDPDDGIVTEEMGNNGKQAPLSEKPANSRVRSYVYGMEALLNKKPGLGTGSLESRVKLVNGNTSSRNEDWYNRRKSYGFEQMHSHDDSTNSISLKKKNLVESSTDSGICRSSEIVVVPTAAKKNADFNDNNHCSSDNNSDSDLKYNGFDNKYQNGVSFGQVKKMATAFHQDAKSSFYNKPAEEVTNSWPKQAAYENDWSSPKTELKSTTITIPIVKNNNVVDLSWNDEPERDVKRHSIAVDEFKYVNRSPNENKYRRTSLALNDQAARQDDEDITAGRRTKKVEFCKTEVHFAAESGKVNIVATDEKPPPTQNFRRRRRNSGPMEEYNKNGLPMLHFGDSSYEKTMFGVTEDVANNNSTFNSIYENVQPPKAPSAFGVVTVNTNNIVNSEFVEEDKKDLIENENIKGILKNKPVKPKPYHLGETVAFSEEDEGNKWDVRLKHVEKEDAPVWKSSVTVRNYYEKPPADSDEEDQPEFQKLLKNLRPTRKMNYAGDNDNKYSDTFSGIRVVSPVKDVRRSSWSVADKAKAVEDGQGVENKGYSTRVNIGEGEATVVESDGFYEKDGHPTWPKAENSAKDTVEKLKLRESSPGSDSSRNNTPKFANTNRRKYSPVVLRKAIPVRPDLKTALTPEKLSSPSLVGRNTSSIDYLEKVEVSGGSPPGKDVKISTDNKSQAKHLNESVVLRQPRKSEMTYFGVNVSPKPVKKISQAVIRKENKLSEKPDLLQHYRKSPSPTRKVKASGKVKSRQKSADADKPVEPIYENVKEARARYTREFDSSILDELTKAADQILQAVNGYTDEDSHARFSTDEEELKKNKVKNEQLDTISETKSWKHQLNTAKSKPPNTKSKLKYTSSTSSVESISRRRANSSSLERKTAPVKTTAERQKKKTDKNESSTAKANTKARRLQRASSREALLQSHGSSSEDLTVNVEAPVRKPRLIKKTKAVQLTMTNGLDLKKPSGSTQGRKKEEISTKTEERILGSLPEIRHKTAVSTIRSTVEKCTRDRTRCKSEDVKKKTQQKRETSRVTSSSTRPEKERNRTATVNKETVTHRISTANIKKCQRSEAVTRH